MRSFIVHTFASYHDVPRIRNLLVLHNQPLPVAFRFFSSDIGRASKSKSKAKVASVKSTQTLSALRAELSDAELQEAEKVILDAAADEKHKRRLESSMMYYVKQSGEVKNGQRLTGAERRQFLLLFVAKSAREKGSTVKTFAADEVENTTYNDDRNHWMGKWVMEAKYGIDRVRNWITSGAMAKRPDPITGSEEDDMCEWAVPRSIEGTRSNSLQKSGTHVDHQHDENDKNGAFKAQGDATADMAACMVRHQFCSCTRSSAKCRFAGSLWIRSFCSSGS